MRKKYITRAKLLIESELNLLYFQIKFPIIGHDTKDGKNIILDWDITDNDIIELSRALYATQKGSKKGKHARFIDIERQLEQFFGKKVKRPHNKVTRISERIDTAPFLNTLINCYIKDLEHRL